MKATGISLLWIICGLYMLLQGCVKYWAYSDPSTLWLGMIPEVYSIGHISIGLHSILIGVKLKLASATITGYLISFAIVLTMFLILVFTREFMIYGQWIANDYLRSELFLLLYGGLVVLTAFHLKTFTSLTRASSWYLHLTSNGGRPAYLALGLCLSMLFLPEVLQYHFFEFIH